MINVSDLLKQPNPTKSNLVLKLPEFEIDETCMSAIKGHISRTAPVITISFYLFTYTILVSHMIYKCKVNEGPLSAAGIDTEIFGPASIREAATTADAIQELS